MAILFRYKSPLILSHYLEHENACRIGKTWIPIRTVQFKMSLMKHFAFSKYEGIPSFNDQFNASLQYVTEQIPSMTVSGLIPESGCQF